MLQRLRAVEVSTIAMACLLAVPLSVLAPAAAGAQVVERVVDGDTIVVRGVGRVRLIGVDTPETVHPSRPVEFFGREASAFAKRLLQGQRVRLEYDREPTDRYGRTLAYVHLADGTFVNAEIILRGYGHAYTRFPFRHLERFRQLEREARAAGRGLLGPSGSAGPAGGGSAEPIRRSGRRNSVGRQRQRPGVVRRGAAAWNRAGPAQPIRPMRSCGMATVTASCASEMARCRRSGGRSRYRRGVGADDRGA